MSFHMVLKGLVWVGSGDKLHAKNHQALPFPGMGLQTEPSLVQAHTHTQIPLSPYERSGIRGTQ